MASEESWGREAAGRTCSVSGQRAAPGAACSRLCNQGPGLGWAGRPSGGRAVRAPPASSLWRTLPRRLGRPQKKTCLLIKMGPFLNLSPCGSGTACPGRSCILSSGLVTTKNRRPSAEAGLSPPRSREARAGEETPAQAPGCGCCRQWAGSRAGLGVRAGGPRPASAPARSAPRAAGLRAGRVAACAESEASARLPGTGGRWPAAGPGRGATRGERGPLAPGRALRAGRAGRAGPGGPGRATLWARRGARWRASAPATGARTQRRGV